ncbi:putative permease [Neisseria sp. HSC-16F19]|nr:AEC family transporter [Neisseria sp. HSC-16F19]MCP2041566.1 putative permease [Neisseria sp. HSC-16F19]
MYYIQLLFPDFSLVLLGYWLCRYTDLNQPIWQAAEKLVYFFLFPVLLFQSITRTPLDVGAAAGLAMAGVLLALASIALAYVLPYLPGMRHIDRRDHAGSAQIAFRFNTFIGLALADRLLGAQGLQLIAVLIGVCVPLVNVGAVWPMARHAKLGVWGQIARNPLIIATALGLACNFAGLGVPEFAQTSVSRIGAASIALGLMAAGAGMRMTSLASSKALSVGVLTIKHLLMPLMAWALARLLNLGVAETTILLTYAALPTASSCYVLAVRMGCNGPLVGGLFTVSTALGVLSLPFALGFLLPA